MGEKLKRNLIELIKDGKSVPFLYKNLLFPLEEIPQEIELCYGLKERKEDVLSDTMSVPFQATKEFHVTIIHRVNPDDLLAQSKEEGIASYIVGGGTKKMFHNPRFTKYDTLDQRDAIYKTIKPICEGLDAYSVTEAIIEKTISLLDVK
jgi:hypothetical protein